MYALRIFSRKWIFFTVLIVLGMVGLARLGIWQLDRHQQKVAYNTQLAERWRLEPYNVNAQALPQDLSELEYRRVAAQGEFDYDRQLLITNQVFMDTPGYIVVTPLVLGPERAILVARGWIPYDKSLRQLWPEFAEPDESTVLGLIRESQALPRPGGWLAWLLELIGAERQAPPAGSAPPVKAPAENEWYRLDVAAIQKVMPYTLEPAYIEQMPEAARTFDQLPIRQEPPLLDEGNHLSYAIQWFTFALVLGFGYIMLVRFRERQAAGLVPSRSLATKTAGDDSRDDGSLHEIAAESIEVDAESPTAQADDSASQAEPALIGQGTPARGEAKVK